MTPPTESDLQEIFGELLGLSSLEPGDNFIDLGGNSLIAMTLIYRVEDDFGCTLKLEDLFGLSLAELPGRCLPLREVHDAG